MITQQHRRNRNTDVSTAAIGQSLVDLPVTPYEWYAGSDLSSSDGTAIPTWTDRVQALTYSQTTAGAQPLIKTAANGINGLPVLRFDGSNDYMVAPGPVSPTALVIAMVIRPLATETTRGIFQFGTQLNDTTPSVLFQRDSTNVKVYFGAAGYRWTIAHASNATHLYFLKWTGTVWTLEVDGVDQGSSYTGGLSGHTGSIWIGNGYNGFSNTDIAEFILWNTSLSSGDQLTSTTYLKTKYGL